MIKLAEHEKFLWGVVAVLTIALLGAYWNSLAGCWEAWQSPQYSFGGIIPLISLGLLYMRRRSLPVDVPIWQRLLGVGIILVAAWIRIEATYRVNMSVDRLMFVPSMFGIFLIVGGFSSMKWVAAPLGFLVLMYPLPGALEDSILRPLQTLATRISLYLLQTLGVECYRIGNRIELNQSSLGVVDACSGLRMLTIFGAMAVALALILSERPWWERLIIVLSAPPIALGVNVFRITLNGLLFNLGFKGNILNIVFHDFAGMFMMPMALGLLWLVFQLLSRLVIEEDQEVYRPLGT